MNSHTAIGKPVAAYAETSKGNLDEQ